MLPLLFNSARLVHTCAVQQRMAYLVFDKAEQGVVEGLELFRLPDQGKALTVSTAQRSPHVHCRHDKANQYVQAAHTSMKHEFS